MPDAWDPQQYDRFKAERSAPFHDLVALVEPPAPGARLADLGCGTGELTATLVDDGAGRAGRHRLLRRHAGRRPRRGPAARCASSWATWPPPAGWAAWTSSLANASLHWVPDHEAVLARWVALLAPGGQLAVQVPANVDHPAHLAADEVAHEAAVRSTRWAVMSPRTRCHVLARALRRGARRARLHPPARPAPGLRAPPGRTADVVEWVKGTPLTRFRDPPGRCRRLAAFVAALPRAPAGGARRPGALLLHVQADPDVGPDRARLRLPAEAASIGPAGRPARMAGVGIDRGRLAALRADEDQRFVDEHPASAALAAEARPAPARRRADAVDDPLARRLPALLRPRRRRPLHRRRRPRRTSTSASATPAP